MHPDAITAILIVFIVIGLPVLSFTLIKLAKIMKGDSGSSSSNWNKSNSTVGQEAQIMQDMHSALNRLEKRIDSLETIILDRSK